MDVDSRVLASETPTLVSPGKITIHHAQLRDLIVCPHERGVVDYIQDESIVRHNLSSGSDPIQLAKFQFRPVNLTSLTLPGTSHTLYASGGFNGDIHISLHAPYPSTEALWEYNTRLEGSMNNSVLMASQVPGSEEPRLVVGNNNNSVKVFDVPVRTRLETLSECGVLELEYPVNHCSISPDGRTLLSVGDSREISLHALSCGPGSSITFERTSTLYLPSQPKSIYTDARPRYYPALFSSAFSSDGTKFAVSSQEGTVVVWDIRSSLPLKVIQTDRTRGCSERPRMTSRCGWCTRSLKFGHGGRAGKEVMVFNETSLLHIVDGQTFETEQVIDVSGLVDGEAQLAGLCFDPSGEFVYTGTTTSIAEWKLT